MHELEKRIGLLRILLADITGKQAQLSQMDAQYRTQLNRIVEFVVHREGDVGNALSLMSEVQGKLDEVSQTVSHLAMIEEKATMELEVLLLTKRVAEARSQLVKLQDRQHELSARLSHMDGVPASPVVDLGQGSAQLEEIHALHDEIEREIARLNRLITEASERAARTVRGEGQQKQKSAGQPGG